MIYKDENMKTKLIYFSDQQINRIGKDALEREISFTEMVRRILDQHYEMKNATFSQSSNDSTFTFFEHRPLNLFDSTFTESCTLNSDQTQILSKL
jgi:site-specific recombinase XerD